MTDQEMDRVVDKAVESTLTRMGFDISDPIACQADMHFLRSARTLTEKAGTKAVMVVIGLATVALVSGVCMVVATAIGS
jgi:hypothetical protein